MIEASETGEARTGMQEAPADEAGRDRELALKLWVVLSRARQAVADHDRADIERHGLTPGEFAVLEVLFHKGPLHMGDVRQKILVSSGGITYLMDRLEEKGLARREPCREDRRASYAVLTAEGEALIGEIFPEHARCLQRALSGLTTAEKEVAVGLLKKLGHRARELEPPGVASPEDEEGRPG